MLDKPCGRRPAFSNAVSEPTDLLTDGQEAFWAFQATGGASDINSVNTPRLRQSWPFLPGDPHTHSTEAATRQWLQWERGGCGKGARLRGCRWLLS